MPPVLLIKVVTCYLQQNDVEAGLEMLAIQGAEVLLDLRHANWDFETEVHHDERQDSGKTASSTNPPASYAGKCHA